MRNGIEVQRIIFSDDKIVYVRVDTGDVKPDNTPDKYVDLISSYNATHSISDNSEHHANSRNKSFIKDGSEDRQNEINRSKDKARLSRNERTQSSINSIRSFGQWLMIGGILQTIVCVFFLLSATADYAGLAVLNLIFSVLYIIFGAGIAKLSFSPGGTTGTAIFVLVIAVIGLATGGGTGLVGLIVIIFAIIALCEVNRYRQWYYGEIE
jgi:hypothetical protein